MPKEFDVVCLGGGVAGEAIATGLQGSGLTLAVVERELVGGECPYWGCVPSKTLLRSGETLSEADRARVLAASRVEWTVDFPKVSTRVRWMARDLDDSRPAAAMMATGARLFRGEGTLTNTRTVSVGFTHLAYYHGQVIARRLRGIDDRADHTAIPRVTFTDPEIASVGLSEAAARAKGLDVVVVSADPAEAVRGYIHDFRRGALKLVADRERGVLVGAMLVTPRAGEIVGELVLAIKLGTPLKLLADVVHPFPAFNRVLGASLQELATKVMQKTEVTMSATQGSKAPGTPVPATSVDLKLEVVVIPVSDVDRAKRFYEGLGWRLDADFKAGENWRGVQMTPPGSPCSIHFGKGITDAAPGSVKNLYLVVTDIDAARGELAARGAEVSGAFHFAGFGTPPLPGPDPSGKSYGTYATFSDPDGNSWLLQEVKTRLPGRGFSTLDVTILTELLREAEMRHGQYEPTAPKHHWSDWYSAYIAAREQGKTPDEAAKDGALRVERGGEPVRV